MNDLYARAHRWSMAITAVLAGAIVVLTIVLGSSDSASGRGEPAVGNGEGSVDLVPVGGGFFSPLNTAFKPGENDKVYVVEQGGHVRVVVGGVTQAAPFLDLTGLTDGQGEQGLLGIAFHPSLDLVYAYYADQQNGDIVVSEFDASDPLDADESSRRQVIRIRHRRASNHYGGQLRFGPDGYLYFATGDGGGGGDPRENAQDVRSLLGKLVRIDPVASGGKPYTVPKGNPLVGRRGRNEIFALGLRNPFRFNFDFDTRRIMIGDVGQDRFEEIDIETRRSVRKANFGWDRWEGFRRYKSPFDNSARKPSRRRHAKPSYAYGQGRGRSVVGGLVVRDQSLSNLYGRYLFADFFANRLRSLVPRLGRVKRYKELDRKVSLISSFTEDPVTREVYLTSLAGNVFRLEPSE